MCGYCVYHIFCNFLRTALFCVRDAGLRYAHDSVRVPALRQFLLPVSYFPYAVRKHVFAPLGRAP